MGRPRTSRVVAWLVLVVVTLGLTRAVVALPERCAAPSDKARSEAAVEAVDWFARNQRADGTWLYRYDAEVASDLGGYSWIRHAGVLLSLEQAAAAGVPGARATADAGREAVRRQLRTVGDRLALEDGGQLTTGGTSLLVAALVERRLSTRDTSDDATLRALGRHLARQVEERGSVLEAADPDTGTTVPGRYSPFSTGEAMFALARLERVFPDEGWGEPARQIGRYLATDRAHREGYVPDASDHWAAYALAEVTQWSRGARLTPDELAFARRQMGIQSIQVRWESQRTNRGLDRWVRGRTALGAAIGTLGEGLAGWATVARAEPALADQRGWLAERLGCAAGLVADRQVTPAEAATYADPARVQGSWLQFGITQMDDQQHTLSALVLAGPVLDDVDQLPRRQPVPAAAWLVLLAAIAALNPARLGFAATSRPGAVALGSALGLGVLGLVAVVGGPVLRALDVSAGTAVVAAGLGLAVAGGATLGWGPGEHTGAAPGWRAALAPVLVPLVLRPELLLLAVAAGAGGRGWALAAGVTIGELAATAISAVRPPGDPVRRWLVRLLGAATLALGVAILVEGVYAV